MRTEERLIRTEEIIPGARTRRRRRRRARGRAFATLVVLAVVAAAVFAGYGAFHKPRASSTRHVIGSGGTIANLFMIRRADDLSRRSDMLVVFALDPDKGKPFVLFVPTEAQVEVPGHGLDSVGRAFSFGGMPLQALSVDNMLGIRLNADVALTDQVLAHMVEQVGGLDITVAQDLLSTDANGQQVPAFDSGRQHMTGQTVRTYLEYQGADETELSRLARAKDVWDALINSWGRLGRARLAQLFGDLGHGYGTGLETGIAPGDLAQFFWLMARTNAEDRVYSTVPVTPIGAGGDEQALRVDEQRVDDMVSQYLRGAIPANAPALSRVQVLNGSGVPQVGQAAGLALIPAGFRLVLDGNANNFAYETTKIIVYSRDDQSFAVARRIHDLLGVGEVDVGLRPQTVVDVTVVLGHDFHPQG